MTAEEKGTAICWVYGAKLVWQKASTCRSGSSAVHQQAWLCRLQQDVIGVTSSNSCQVTLGVANVHVLDVALFLW